MNHSGMKRLLAILLGLMMLFGTVGAQAFADGTDREEPANSVTEEATEAAEPQQIAETDDAPEADEASIEAPAEEGDDLSEIDPDLDTDGDGIADVDELTFGTDPKASDTDGDGLSDYDELYAYDTDPVKGDTDADGLSDGDEIACGADPKNQDTDGDGILDGDELALGTNPLKADEIADVFQSYEGSGFTIEGYAPFVLFREGVAAPYGVDSFCKNPALVGTPVEIRLPAGGRLILKLTVDGAKEMAIFRMNENGTVRLDAEQNGKTYSVALEENGVYYAADLKKLNSVLGFDGAKPGVPENAFLLEDFRYVTLSAPLTAGSDTDTDGDGIPDCEEIGDAYEIDLGNGYTATVYGYVSDPTLMDSDFDGIRDDLDTLPRSNNFSGTYKSGSSFTINLTYSMDYQDFLGDNKVYNAAIASFSVWAAQLCYENEDNDVSYTPNETLYDNGSAIQKVYRIDTLMRAHGMQNVIDYQLENGYFDSDVSLPAYSDDDITEVFFGHHKVTEGDEDYEIISVFVRGTNGTPEEWSSNFNIGNLYRYSDDYDAAEGKLRFPNGDWNRKSNHRGFDVCATRIYRALATYMNKYVDSDATPIFWLAGHSRGAAIANIVSATYVDEGNKVFAYTYASPNTTANTEASAEKYDCIFNLVNGDDFVPRLPMPAWGFSRYGRTATIFASTASSSQRSTYLGNTSYRYKSDSDLQALVNKFAAMTKNNAGGNDGWRDVYVYHCGHQHADEQKGEYRTGCIRKRSGLEFGFNESMFNSWSQRVQRYAYWSSSESGICETPAYAMQVLAELMGNLNLSGGWDYLTTNKLADRYDFGKTSLINYATGIADPHYMENYYLIQTALLSDPDSTFNTNNSLYTNASHRPQHTHSYEIVEMKQAPTCTEPGVAHVRCRCSQVNSAWYDDEIKEMKLPATGHNYGTPAWTWVGLTKATATFTCANDGTHVETRSTTDIVRTENGDLAVYTATVEFEGQTYTDTKEVEIGYYLIGSMTDWEVDETYRFTANTAAEGEYLLNVADLAIGAEIKVVRAEGATKLNWYPDYGGNYVVDYPHSGNVNVYFRPAGNVWNDFFNGGYFYISKLHTVTVITDGNGSAAVDPAAPDFTATVTLTATPNTGYHFDRVEFYEKIGEGENDLQAVNITLDEDDTFIMPDYDVVIKVYFAAHTWSEPNYTWEAEGEGWKCTATRECTTEGCDAVETETVTATYAVTTDPTCEGAGEGTYTATFTNEAFEAQTKTVNIDPIGHDWEFVDFTWTGDDEHGYTAAVANYVCKNDATHTETVAATITAETTPATITDAGETVYTATVTAVASLDGEEHTESKTVELPILVPKFRTHNLILSGEIGINFFMDLSMLTDAQKQASYMTFSIPHGPITESDSYDAACMNNAGTYYGFTCYIVSIQMAEEITATYHYGDNLTVEETYSVKQYLNTFDEHMNEFDEKTIAAVHAIGDFGHYVQPFLAKANNWTIGNEFAEMDKYYTGSYDLTAVKAALASYKSVKGLNQDIVKITYQLVLASETSIRVFFRPAKGYTGTFTATIGDGTENVAVLQSDGRYMVETQGIPAHQLGMEFTITTTTDCGTATTKVSGLSYMNELMNHPAYESDNDALNAMASVYYYYMKVKAANTR